MFFKKVRELHQKAKVITKWPRDPDKDISGYWQNNCIDLNPNKSLQSFLKKWLDQKKSDFKHL